jgi:hypothetical protein
MSAVPMPRDIAKRLPSRECSTDDLLRRKFRHLFGHATLEWARPHVASILTCLRINQCSLEHVQKASCAWVIKDPRRVSTESGNDRVLCRWRVALLKLSLPKIEHQPIQMKGGRRILDAVLAHRITHHFELFACAHEGVNKSHFIYRMHIVVVTSKNDQ